MQEEDLLFSNMMNQLSPEKLTNEDFVNVDLYRPRSNSSP